MLLLDYPKWNNYMFVMSMVKPTPELQAMSDLLDDISFEEPILENFYTCRGRPTAPVKVYIRMMVLKFFLGLKQVSPELLLLSHYQDIHIYFHYIPIARLPHKLL